MTQGKEMAQGYHPKDVEAQWYSHWESRGWFGPKANTEAAPFVTHQRPVSVASCVRHKNMANTLTGAIADTISRFTA